MIDYRKLSVPNPNLLPHDPRMKPLQPRLNARIIRGNPDKLPRR